MPSDPIQKQAAVQALAETLALHYPEEILLTLGEGSEGPVALAERLVRQETLERLVRSGDKVHEALIALARTGPQPRGEQARREGILIGLGDIEPGLRRLVAKGLVVMLPAPGQRDWDLFDELETRRYLQREVLLPPRSWPSSPPCSTSPPRRTPSAPPSGTSPRTTPRPSTSSSSTSST